MNFFYKISSFSVALLLVSAAAISTLYANHHDLPDCSTVLLPQPGVNCYENENYNPVEDNPNGLPICTGQGTDLPGINCYQPTNQNGDIPLEVEIEGGNPAPDTNSPAGDSQTLQNPIKSQTILQLITKIIDVLIIFAVPIIILFIMYAGFLFVTSAGSEEKLKKAKRALLWAIVGGVIALGAKLIITVIEGTIKQF